MSAKDNIFLKVSDTAVLTPATELVIISLEPRFKSANVHARVTSVLRKKEDQLRIIRGYLNKTGLADKYPEAMNCAVEDKIQFNDEKVYAWQIGWSALLNKGIIISPVLDAKCLMDYIGKDGKNRKGRILFATPHYDGYCFDIGGGPDGIAGTVDNELAVMQLAIKEKHPGLESILPEHGNNAIHCVCTKTIPMSA